MTKTKSFTHNPIQVNTYLIYDETKECIIIDPACYNKSEKNELSDFISENRLIPVKIINTHGHFDHITGNKYLAEKYNIDICINNNDLELYKNSKQSAMLFGIEFDAWVNKSMLMNGLFVNDVLCEVILFVCVFLS